MAHPGEVEGRPGRTVGIVGAGQLARMLCEAASQLGLHTVVLAEHEDDAAVAVAGEVLVGRPTVASELRALARRVDVVTFDHEQVDVGLLATLEAEGVAVHPGTATLAATVDKATMRRRLADAGVPVPAFAIVSAPTPPADSVASAKVAEVAETAETAETGVAAVARFAKDHGWPVVVKAARGGYDGKGVWPVHDATAARAVCRRGAEAGVPLLVEEMVPIEAELAILVARHPGGRSVTWPVVQTVQVDGVCREVLAPAPQVEAAAEAAALGHRVAEAVGATGLLAVELFWTGGRVLVNELAARPHNSGHWTIEGAQTSQFENHLRAVLGLPLGDTTPLAPAVANVNVFGPADGSNPLDHLAGALAVEGAHVHLYGKAPRPGRKLGHVTVTGTDLEVARARAWAAARALATPVPSGPGRPEPKPAVVAS